MSDAEKKYAYSFDEEAFTGSMTSKVEAIAEALAERGDEHYHFWIGECTPFKPSGMADTIIDQLQTDADDHAGEFAEDYLRNISREHKDVLDNFILKWLEQIETPSFYTVNNSVQFTIAEAEAFLEAQSKAAV